MAYYANLNDASTTFDDGKDSVVIVDCLYTIRGGVTLDTTSFLQSVIRAGHVIIKETSTGKYKPMPMTGYEGGVATLGTTVAGSGYTNGTYTGIPLTGGTGTGATATVVVASGAVSSVTLVNSGYGYTVDDSLTATLGPAGSGFAVPVATLTTAGVYSSLPSGHTYQGVLRSSILTAKPFAGVMIAGVLNPTAAPNDFATIASAFATAVPAIIQRAD
jgi:hypothetical protein